MRVESSYWHDRELRIQGDTGPLPWHGSIHWRVSEEQLRDDPPECVFEPRCLRFGEPCNCSIGAKPHVVYAAFYGELPKVGMTSARRIMARLREQGADAGFIIARTADRGAARRIEKEVRVLHRIPEWRTHKEKLPLLAKELNWDRITARADALRAKLESHFDPSPDLMRIDHPLDVLPRRPHKMATAGVHRGDVIGAKGPYLFYRPRGIDARLEVGDRPVLALKHTDLVGRVVESLD